MRHLHYILIILLLGSHAINGISFSEFPDDMIRQIMNIFLVQELRQAEKQKSDLPLLFLNEALKSIYCCAATNRQNKRAIEEWIKSDSIKNPLCAWINKVSHESYNKVMETAICMRRFYMTRFFLDTGFSAQVGLSYGRSLLHVAAFHNANNIIRLLVNRGALVNSQDQQGYTPLHQTIFGDGFDAAKELLGLGADPRIKNKAERTALQEIVWRLDNATQLVNGYEVRVFTEPPRVFKLLQEYEKRNG